jgi:pyruvyltransferase
MLNLGFRKPFHAYWWDGKQNFGDLVTKAALGWLGARRVVNVRRSSRDRGPALVGAGSVLQGLRYPSSVIWGSGFISDDHTCAGVEPLEPLEVLAFRGPRTREIAERLGWKTSEIFCDPGLLLSMMHDAQPRRHEVGFVPHYWHAASIEEGKGLEGVKIIDVSQSVESAAAELSACKVVVSTSLHGIVTAHAYGIPWVWAKMDPVLVGDEFKFYDFLEGMRISASPVHISPQEIKEGCLNDLAKHARLPEGEDVIDKQRALLSALLSSDVLAMPPLLNKRLD